MLRDQNMMPCLELPFVRTIELIGTKTTLKD